MATQHGKGPAGLQKALARMQRNRQASESRIQLALPSDVQGTEHFAEPVVRKEGAASEQPLPHGPAQAQPQSHAFPLSILRSFVRAHDRHGGLCLLRACRGHSGTRHSS